MKHLDRVKVTASALSSLTLSVGAVITLGAALTGMRTLAQALADGATFSHTVKVGDTNISFMVDDGNGNWVNALFTLTSTTQITLTQILTSSTGGGAVTFLSQTPTVYNSDSSFALNTGLINPFDAGFDIILLLGQSNMVGQDSTIAALDIVDPRIFTYGSYANEAATYRKITQAVDPLRHNISTTSYPTMPAAGNGAGLGPGSWLARTYAGMVPANRKILLVPAARSNTKLFADTHEWFPGDGTIGSGAVLGATGSVLLDFAIDQVNQAIAEAKALYPNSRFVGTAWHQGEGDADYYGASLQINYAGAFKTLIQAIRARVTGAANSWVVIGGLMAENVADTTNHPGYTLVDAAHRQVASEVARVGYTPGLSGYQMVDHLHYNAAGQRILGCNMAALIPLAYNSRGVDTTAPVLRSATVYASSTSTVAVALSEPFDPAYTPQASAWTVSGHTVTAASGNGNYVYLTVSSPFVNGEATRTVTFTGPANLRDLAGNMMLTQSAMNITNNAPVIDSTPPTLNSPTVPNNAPATVTLTASESLDTTNVPAVSAFTVSGHTITSVAVTSTTVTLTLGEVFVAGEAARTVDYTQPASAGLRDLAGNLMVSFSGMAVTNNAPATDTTPPTFASAQVANASPTVVQITMSESLGASVPPTSAFTITEGGVTKTVSSVSVSGTIVSVTMAAAFSSGTTIQATYTAPGTDPRIKDVAGNAAVTFGPVTVTNNIAAAGSSTDVRFPNLVAGNTTETSATPPYAYQTAGSVNFGASPQGASTTVAAAGDFTLEMTINTVSARQMVGFKTSAPNIAYGSIPFVFWAENSTGGGYKLRGTTASQAVTGRVPVNNDKVRIVRVGSTITAYVSSDSGTTWTQILTWVQSGTLYCQILSESNGQFNGPVGSGWA